MLQVVDINVDRTELMLTVSSGKKTTTQTVAFDKVLKVRLKQDTVKRWFSTKQVKRIELYVKDKEEPFVISSDTVKSFEATEGYIRQLAGKFECIVEQS